MNDDWSKMPCGWQTDPLVHQALRNLYEPGTAIAALKLYLALCLKARFKSYGSLPPGAVQRSLSQLAKLTGLSKPMVIAGLRALQELNIVLKLGGRPCIYQLVGYEQAPGRYWTKLPRKTLYGTHHKTGDFLEGLIGLANRGQASFEALQLYLYIAAVRDRLTDRAKVTYDRISEVLHMSRNAVSRAISTLVSLELVGVRLDDEAERIHPCNVYWLNGTFNTSYRRTSAEDDFDGLDEPQGLPFVDYAKHL